MMRVLALRGARRLARQLEGTLSLADSLFGLRRRRAHRDSGSALLRSHSDAKDSVDIAKTGEAIQRSES